jgi:hypothetical protein
VEEQLRERVIQPKELGMNLRRFRQQLGLTQSVFGQTFATTANDRSPVRNWRNRNSDGTSPLDSQEGYPLQVVLGESQTDALDKVVGYLSASWRIHETTKRLTESVLRLLDRESVTVSSIMSNLGVSPEVDTNRETFTLRDMLRRAGIEPSLSLETEEEHTK